MVRGGGAPPPSRSVRGGYDDPRRAHGADQPRPGAADRRREGAARRPDELRPQARAAGAARSGNSTPPGRRSEPLGRATRRTPKPPGMLAEWRLGVVFEETDREARSAGWSGPSSIRRRRRSPAYGNAGPVRSRLGRVPSGTAGSAVRRAVWPISRSPETRDDRAAGPPRRHREKSRAGPPPSASASCARSRLVQGCARFARPEPPGACLAMVGGWSFEQSQFNRATQAIRQPGSSFKPIVYLTALEQGISPSQRFLDGPLQIGDWRPNNYSMTFTGPVSMHSALERSLNLVTVRIAQKVGMIREIEGVAALHAEEVALMPLLSRLSPRTISIPSSRDGRAWSCSHRRSGCRRWRRGSSPRAGSYSDRCRR